MALIDYHLVSRPHSVKIPAKYAKEADKLVFEAFKYPFRLIYSHIEYPSLSDPEVRRCTAELCAEAQGTPKSIILRDIVFLRVCLHYSEREATGEDMRVSIALDQMVDDLESLIEYDFKLENV